MTYFMVSSSWDIYWNFIGTTKREKYSTGDSTDMWDLMIDSYFNFGVIAGNLVFGNDGEDFCLRKSFKTYCFVQSLVEGWKTSVAS